MFLCSQSEHFILSLIGEAMSAASFGTDPREQALWMTSTGGNSFMEVILVFGVDWLLLDPLFCGPLVSILGIWVPEEQEAQVREWGQRCLHSHLPETSCIFPTFLHIGLHRKTFKSNTVAQLHSWLSHNLWMWAWGTDIFKTSKEILMDGLG